MRFYTIEEYILFCYQMNLNVNLPKSLYWFKEYCKGLDVIYK